MNRSIDEAKKSGQARLKYHLKNANVFVSPEGYHFTEYLDPADANVPNIDFSVLTEEEISYIEKGLQSNLERFENQVAVVKKYLAPANAQILDIGCGGGLFMHLLQECGANVTGIELSDIRVHYARKKFGLCVHKYPVDAPFWQERDDSQRFDLITLWDVIEHVNYPEETLSAAVRLLRDGGFLMIDTPCRDGFYHRVGKITYAASGGRYPTFLNAMYSNHQFGHKQIFSTLEMRGLFQRQGLRVRELRKFYELSFPYEFYLQKMIRNRMLIKSLLPLIRLFLGFVKVRNKMIVVGQKV